MSIGKAAHFLGVSPMTLRRWEKSGKLVPRRTPTGHRRYAIEQMSEALGGSIASRALVWVSESKGTEPDSAFYCLTGAIFQERLMRVERELARLPDTSETYSLILAAAGEIGNNSFDHNIGNWPDIPGIFFAFDRESRSLVLADRGQGILKTLQQIRPTLASDREALTVAFTEILSGRSPEARGNGLKLVRKIAPLAGVEVSFRTGNACLLINKKHPDIQVEEAKTSFHGCLAILRF